MKAILRYGSVRGLIAALVALVLSSCSAAPTVVEPTPTVQPATVVASAPVAGAVISEQAAIAAALKSAAMADGHIIPEQEPTNIHAELVPADKAPDRLVADGLSGSSADASNGAIWLISMDGTWQVNGPPQLPGITPSPLDPLHHMIVALDAGTGALVSVSGR
jgi:hypothetical protein